jgi:hypothetical protein
MKKKMKQLRISNKDIPSWILTTNSHFSRLEWTLVFCEYLSPFSTQRRKTSESRFPTHYCLLLTMIYVLTILKTTISWYYGDDLFVLFVLSLISFFLYLWTCLWHSKLEWKKKKKKKKKKKNKINKKFFKNFDQRQTGMQCFFSLEGKCLSMTRIFISLIYVFDHKK